jgi:hypothetical protein
MELAVELSVGAKVERGRHRIHELHQLFQFVRLSALCRESGIMA